MRTNQRLDRPIRDPDLDNRLVHLYKGMGYLDFLLALVGLHVVFPTVTVDAEVASGVRGDNLINPTNSMTTVTSTSPPNLADRVLQPLALRYS